MTSTPEEADELIVGLPFTEGTSYRPREAFASTTSCLNNSCFILVLISSFKSRNRICYSLTSC